MKKQIILSSLFFVTGLFLSSVQAADLDDLEVCPTNSSGTPPVVESSESPKTINPLLPKGANQEVRAETGHEADDNRVEGYTCKVPVVETRPDSDEGYKGEGYKGEGYVQWTLMKKEGDKEIWAVHTLRWGLIYVGDVEDGVYTFSEAKEVCENKEIVINGKKIEMTLPEIGFGKGDSDIKEPLNFELLKYLNYTSVVSNRDQNWFWSSSLSDYYRYAWVFHPASGNFYDGGLRNLYDSVRCVGR